MTTVLVLAVPDNEYKFGMKIDVLEYAISGTLFQQQTVSF